MSKIDVVVKKGWDKRVEMFSGFGDMFGNRGEGIASVDLEKVLKEKGITHVYTVGLTGDCCVR
jgi:nicotinamidase-related amidase